MPPHLSRDEWLAAAGLKSWTKGEGHHGHGGHKKHASSSSGLGGWTTPIVLLLFLWMLLGFCDRYLVTPWREGRRIDVQSIREAMASDAAGCPQATLRMLARSAGSIAGRLAPSQDGRGDNIRLPRAGFQEEEEEEEEGFEQVVSPPPSQRIVKPPMMAEPMVPEVVVAPPPVAEPPPATESAAAPKKKKKPKEKKAPVAPKQERQLLTADDDWD